MKNSVLMLLVIVCITLSGCTTPGAGADTDLSDYYTMDQINTLLSDFVKYNDGGSVTFNSAFTIPAADGTSDYILKTNGTGTVSWQADSTATAGSLNIGDMADVNTAGVTNNSILKYNGSNWVIGTDNDSDNWTITGSDIYYTTGNVGIGVSSPTDRLEIQGATSDNSSNALSIVNSSSTSLLEVRNDGVVGIGSPSSMLYQLEVYESGAADTIARFESSDADAYIALVDGNAVEGLFGIYNGTLVMKRGSGYVAIADNDFVGILAIDPKVPLDINSGSLRLRYDTTPASSSATGWTGQIQWDANYIYVCTSGDGAGAGTDTWKRASIGDTW